MFGEDDYILAFHGTMAASWRHSSHESETVAQMISLLPFSCATHWNEMKSDIILTDIFLAEVSMAEQSPRMKD